MQWHSVGEFLAMGGYAVYVWGSVGACAVAMIVEPLLLKGRHRRLQRSLRPGRAAGPGQRGYNSSVTAEGTR
jgi:heme exporter protein D